MKQLIISDFKNVYEYKQAKKAAINNAKVIKTERKNKRQQGQ